VAAVNWVQNNNIEENFFEINERTATTNRAMA